MTYNPREKYFINNWKKLNKRQRLALCKNVSWFNICADSTVTLDLSFIREFEQYIFFEQLFVFGNISESVLEFYCNKLPENLISLAFIRNNYSEKFLMKNISSFIKHTNIILTSQKSLSSESKKIYATMYELIS